MKKPTDRHQDLFTRPVAILPFFLATTLLEYGRGASAITAVNEQGDTALMLAAENGFTAMCSLLHDYGANVEASQVMYIGQDSLFPLLSFPPTVY